MQKRKQKSSTVKLAPKNAKPNNGFIRIISGLWKGRKLKVHDLQGLRPTTDRVKETVFNWIAQEVPQANCLDLFAGAGSLGFEAASRQAKRVTMIELNRQAYSQLQSNIEMLKAENINLLQQDALHFLKQEATPYDVVFIDPPFRQDLLTETIQLLNDHGWLANNAFIYIETEKELNLPKMPAGWDLYREKTAGQVRFQLYQYTV